MNGAERLLETLVDSGVELCFANPGTSEMQLVSAIDNSEKMRAVLCLFEGVVCRYRTRHGRTGYASDLCRKISSVICRCDDQPRTATDRGDGYPADALNRSAGNMQNVT